MEYAKIENNEVVNILVTDDDFDSSLFDGKYISLSKYPNARIGDKVDSNKDIYALQPFPSWKLNRTTFTWEAPKAYPKSEGLFIWNEEKKDWENFGTKEPVGTRS